MPVDWVWPDNQQLEWVGSYEFVGDTLHIEACMGCPVNFENLQELSTLFGTTKINMRNTEVSTGGCETCNFYYDDVRVIVSAITRWPT